MNAQLKDMRQWVEPPDTSRDYTQAEEERAVELALTNAPPQVRRAIVAAALEAMAKWGYGPHNFLEE